MKFKLPICIVGYFEAGVWVRRVGQEGDFYSSRRVDFELYL